MSIQQLMWATAYIKDGHTLPDSLVYAMSELGELSDEIMIVEGKSDREAGVDGVVGEAVDVIVCMLDIIHKADPTVCENDIVNIAKAKIKKWQSKASA